MIVGVLHWHIANFSDRNRVMQPLTIASFFFYPALEVTGIEYRVFQLDNENFFGTVTRQQHQHLQLQNDSLCSANHQLSLG